MVSKAMGRVWRGRRWLLGALLGMAAVVAGCSDAGTEATAVAESDPPSTTEATAATTEPEETTIPEDSTSPDSTSPDAEPVDVVFEDFESAVFSDPTTIDNRWLPLTPGTRSVLSGTAIEDGEEIDHRIEFIVTDLTKEIAGVETVVAWIEDYSDDELVEAELAFYAQDDAGHVWFLGEYPEEYEEGEFVAAPTWIAGIEEAKAGLKMYAGPEVGIPAYYQGWGPAVGWSDFGTIEATGQDACAALGCYDDVVVIAESSLEEEGAFQLKSYAPGVGGILVDFRGDDANQEQLELVEFGPVTQTELEQYRAAALEMEAHANEISPDVYGLTPALK